MAVEERGAGSFAHGVCNFACSTSLAEREVLA